MSNSTDYRKMFTSTGLTALHSGTAESDFSELTHQPFGPRARRARSKSMAQEMVGRTAVHIPPNEYCVKVFFIEIFMVVGGGFKGRGTMIQVEKAEKLDECVCVCVCVCVSEGVCVCVCE